MFQRFRKYFMIILVTLSILVPMALLYYVDAPSFDKTWKGRTFYLFFVWLFAMELILDWEKYETEPVNKPRSVVRLMVLAVASLSPTVYVILEYFYGLNAALVDLALRYGIGPAWFIKDYPYVVPLAAEYLVFTILFTAIFVLAFGLRGLKGFSLSTALLAVIGVTYTIDNLYPQGNFTPFMILVPATATLASWILNLMGYLTSFGSPVQGMPALSAGKTWPPSTTFYIAWPCSGVESLLIYTVVILLFLKKTAIPLWQKITYFAVGAVVTYFVNALRIVTIFIIAINGGNIWPFHDYYGPLYSIVWITSYPLIIIGSQMLWRKIRPEKIVVQNDTLLAEDRTTIPRS